MDAKEAGALYDKIIQYATIPALLICIVLSIIIIQFLMSTKWQQARRNKQIRKAVAERKRAAVDRSDTDTL